VRARQLRRLSATPIWSLFVETKSEGGALRFPARQRELWPPKLVISHSLAAHCHATSSCTPPRPPRADRSHGMACSGEGISSWLQVIVSELSNKVHTLSSSAVARHDPMLSTLEKRNLSASSAGEERYRARIDEPRRLSRFCWAIYPYWKWGL